MTRPVPHATTPTSRREWLLQAAAGFGALPLLDLMAKESGASAPSWAVPATAKSCIFLFMEGGPSQMDLFDPKPLLKELAGKPIPPSFKPVITPMGEFYSPILPSRRTWKQHGESGAWVSDWLPHTAEIVDDLAIVRSCWADGLNHVNGVCQMNTGSTRSGRPSLGSWVSYGLGTENQDLPAFVVLQDYPKSLVAGGPRNWGTGFMPATHQGTRFDGVDVPVANLRPPATIAGGRQEAKLALLDRLNRRHQDPRADQTELDARIKSYELAYRMQAEAPDAVDLSLESAETRALYGMDDPVTEGMARNCLLARRLVERGVRFVQIYCGAGSKWDSHQDLEGNHGRCCRSSDKPVAALVKDLKRRGLLDQTLVGWGGEFGRTPMSEKGDGRDHNANGFTMWMAGGGIKPGITLGATDEAGLHAIEDRLHVHDLHATVLHLLGLDHTRLTFRHAGRDFRLTDVKGNVVEGLIA